ncbi:MAG: DNA-binding transcriptional ArsR family regulator [Saprospiraceae bacterium]|jgi:DNA-binding transcriptional ArsR family regulator
MGVIEISKVLSNEVRFNILLWLKEPEANFPPHQDLGHFDNGVCVQYIGDKAGLSQSTISHYLSMMQRIGFIDATRHGKWTYYKRNEEVISNYLNYLKKNL